MALKRYLVIRSSGFNLEVARLKKKFKDIEKDLAPLFEEVLAHMPTLSASCIPNSGGVWKIRWGIKSARIAKRGGLRIFYLIEENALRVYCVAIIFKRQQEDIAATELARAVREAGPSLAEDLRRRGITDTAKLYEMTGVKIT